MSTSQRAILLSAYDASSHARWRRQLQHGAASHHWKLEPLTLPPRFFAWRIRSNSLSWAFEPESRQALLDPDIDLLLATSMVDLNGLRGFLPQLARLPTVLYFHENQLAYPTRGPHAEDVHPAILQIYAALCADVLLFNSSFNRDTFLQGADALLHKMPDHLPPGLLEHIASRSRLLPVPLEDELLALQQRRPARSPGPLRILWNHRWEYDKSPERFFDVLEQLAEQGQPFELIVAGQSFRRQPECFARAKDSLREQIIHWGYVERRQDYHQLLMRADVVVSTALHDFQGLSVQEACCAKALPVVPDRLAYRDWFDPSLRYDSYPEQPEREARALLQMLRSYIGRIQAGQSLPEPPSLEHLSASRRVPEYFSLFDALSTTARERR